MAPAVRGAMSATWRAPARQARPDRHDIKADFGIDPAPCAETLDFYRAFPVKIGA
jgi:hypothetical protein